MITFKMGEGYVIECKNCGQRIELLTGVGNSIPYPDIKFALRLLIPNKRKQVEEILNEYQKYIFNAIPCNF